MNAAGLSAPPRVRTIRRGLALLTLALAVGAIAWGVRESSRTRPPVDELIELAEAGKLAEAASRGRDLAARYPDDGATRLLLAQILLKLPESQPSQTGRDRAGVVQEALEHLGGVKPDKPRMAATFHLTRGIALDLLGRLDEAEADWLESLRIDPTTPEASFNLLNLYYLQWRDEEARRLALRLIEVEPDPHDRTLLLVELLRHDARPPAPGSLVKLFEPVVRDHPGELHAAMALGLAYTRAGDVEKGIDQLRRVVKAHPDRVEARDCLLTCLDESGQVDAMEEELDHLPAGIAGSPRLLKHRARIAQGNRWKEAVELYRQAQSAEPYNRVVEYRLSRALRHLGQADEADRIEARLRRRDVAIQELRPLYDQATETRNLRASAHFELFQKIAEARERMQFLDEARAWHRLVLLDQPGNAASTAALARLGPGGDQRRDTGR
jgi:tetratricopeptide (TPR) repeat protein